MTLIVTIFIGLYFDFLKDDTYVVNCCLQSTLSTIEETFELLSYARNRVRT